MGTFRILVISNELTIIEMTVLLLIFGFYLFVNGYEYINIRSWFTANIIHNVFINLVV